MDKNRILSILRNPYGWDDNQFRKVRHVAADILEQLPDNVFEYYFNRKERDAKDN